MIAIEYLYSLYQKHPQVITDSRKIEEECLFFALKGERFNGNEYAKDAIQKGAAYAIIDEAKFDQGEQFLFVEDVLTTLQQLANYHRKQFMIPILGITGSNGKTTTKELIASVLSSQYKCHFTKGNFNNHIGVPLTLLEMPKETEIAVIEMGANHIGEIEFLCEIAEPTHGVITNIGKAHLEGFGSLEGVKKAKSELYVHLKKNGGVAFINMNENFLTDLSDGITKRVFYTKSDSPNLLEAPYETILFQTHPTVEVGFLNEKEDTIKVVSQLLGDYNFNNIMTVISIGRYFKVPSILIKKAIENYVPSNNRSQLVKRGTNTFILDAYNANPTSMLNALENFNKIKGDKKIVVLGDMLELGEYSSEEHLRIVRHSKTMDLSKIVLVGKEFSKIDDNEVFAFEDVQSMKEWFDQQSFENTYVLVKGSRGIRLEKLLDE